jgi:DNA-binding transcriptional MerR regulator
MVRIKLKGADPMISITDLAAVFKVSIRTIRYYEQLGLIQTSTRFQGKRHFNRQETLNRMEEIVFLKSLGFKLKEIKTILYDPFYVKAILINIQMKLISWEITHLLQEQDKLETALSKINWQIIEVTDKEIIQKMKKNYPEMTKFKQAIDAQESISTKDIHRFVQHYKDWYSKNGFVITDQHIKTMAFKPEAGASDANLREIFKQYSQIVNRNSKK